MVGGLLSNQARLLVVVWTQRENIIRIITAFFPTKSQERSTPMQDIDLEYERYKNLILVGRTRTQNT